jgi:hypothetical protein
MRAIATLLALALRASAVTIYSQQPLGDATATATAPGASYTGLSAYDTTPLNPPPLPNPRPAREFSLTLQPSADLMPGLSIPQKGSFFGFSIEMSVVNQVCEWPPAASSCRGLRRSSLADICTL